MAGAQFVARMLAERVGQVRVDYAPGLGRVMYGGERALSGDSALLHGPEAAASFPSRLLRHEALPHQRVVRPVDVEIEAERQEMVVVDRNEMRRDQRAGAGLPRGRGIDHVARRDALD